MIGQTLRTRGQIVSRYLPVGPTELEFQVAQEPTLQLGLFAPSVSPDNDDGSPREMPAYTIRWGAFPGPKPLPAAGTRVLVGGEVWELLEAVRELRHGWTVKGYQATAQLVEKLYPYSATLTDQSGSELAELRVALWSASEQSDDRGEFLVLEGEAPAEHYPHFTGPNRSLAVGSSRIRVTSAVLDTAGPRVKLQLRKTRA